MKNRFANNGIRHPREQCPIKFYENIRTLVETSAIQIADYWFGKMNFRVPPVKLADS